MVCPDFFIYLHLLATKYVLLAMELSVYLLRINVTLVTEENHPEGLFSPDVFNGKGLFSNFIKEGDSNV